MLVFASIALAFAAHPGGYQPLTFFTAPCIGQGISLDFAGEDGRWTYHNLTVGLADIAPTMVAQRDEGAGTYYRLIKSSTMLEGYLHGYERYGWDYNPDQLAFSSTVNGGEMNPAMITLLAQGEGDDAATQLMAFQFYGLERGQAAGTFKFTLRTYPTFDDSQFEPHRTAHSVYDKHQPHFHTLPEAGKTAIVAPPRASATWTTCSLEIYLTPVVDSIAVAAEVLDEAGEVIGGASDA
eukprot:CAMPEP_0196688990 /NCGR_PEP_ID=MMETSP1090-20130531/17611_1 /TAXON_ID=37098 /ORGANISM="Isochrysis sp, Strain CCMP1244" /LENGTH=237 /DNA_ID=CAMNT_0042027957 /DNA_START=72 /DNA_END=785 /DNA_ORIENTATION=-